VFPNATVPTAERAPFSIVNPVETIVNDNALLYVDSSLDRLNRYDGVNLTPLTSSTPIDVTRLWGDGISVVGLRDGYIVRNGTRHNDGYVWCDGKQCEVCLDRRQLYLLFSWFFWSFRRRLRQRALVRSANTRQCIPFFSNSHLVVPVPVVKHSVFGTFFRSTRQEASPLITSHTGQFTAMMALYGNRYPLLMQRNKNAVNIVPLNARIGALAKRDDDGVRYVGESADRTKVRVVCRFCLSTPNTNISVVF
jgi:hypothetical protein